MSLVKVTTTGDNYLQKVNTEADIARFTSLQLYERQTGSEGISANTIFTITEGTYRVGSNTLMVFINGQKCTLETSPSDATEYEETSSNKVTFGGTLLDTDVVEFIVVGSYITTTTEAWVSYDENDANEILNAGDRILASTATSGYTLYLPASPNIDDIVRVADRNGTWNTNNLILDNNTNNVRGIPSGITCDLDNASIGLIYTGASYGWTYI